MLKQNKQKRIRNMHKQQLKIVDIHEKLLDEGFKISYTTVRNFISAEEKRHREVFIRQSLQLVKKLSLIGEVKLLIQDKYRKYSLALFTLPYSNQRFGYLYESETMICVQDVHVKCIEYLQFVPAVLHTIICERL